MTDTPDLDRFRALADAYGGVVARWPTGDRDAARRVAATPAGKAILAAASSLDARLDDWRVPAPGEAVGARILAVATRGVSGRLRWWWSGIGIAAALAGAATGTAAVAIATPADTGAPATAFGDLAGSED